MADNTQINQGSGGPIIATDEIAGVQYQRVKIVLGGDGVNEGDLASGNKMPTNETNSAAILAKLTADPSTGSKQDALLNAVDGVEASLGNINTGIGNLLAETSFNSRIGATNETPPASDTAASGLNGRLQRIAQRITSLISLLPISIGQKNKAGSLSVTIASDQEALPVNTGLNQGLTNAELRNTPVDVIAHAGSNLNTSSLGLETTQLSIKAAVETLDNFISGARGLVTEDNSAAIKTAVESIKTAVEIMDDWDETDRAKVNLIAAQAGVEGGSGGVTAKTIRVSLATDVALPAGNNAIGKLAANAGVEIGNVGIVPKTSGGFSTYHLVSAGSTNASSIKASTGQVFGWYIFNNSASIRKVVFHNTAGSPTAGAGVFFTLVIPPGSGANVFNPAGIEFSAGIAITTVTGMADNDTTAVTANDLNINIFYK